jgi:hypothetical protein
LPLGAARRYEACIKFFTQTLREAVISWISQYHLLVYRNCSAREHDRDGCSRSGLAFDANFAAVRLDDLTRNKEIPVPRRAAPAIPGFLSIA